MSSRPDAATLDAWWQRWRAVKLAAYRELVASYTPEQRAIIARMNEASRQQRLCSGRARWPEGYDGKHYVVWPDEPPA